MREWRKYSLATTDDQTTLWTFDEEIVVTSPVVQLQNKQSNNF